MIFKNKEIVELLTKKETLVIEGREVTKKIEELENDRRKIGLQIQKVKDKVIPMVNKLMEGNLKEFEEIGTVEVKDGELDISIVDVVENFKRDYKEAKNKTA
jgi:hypothetical protein